MPTRGFIQNPPNYWLGPDVTSPQWENLVSWYTPLCPYILANSNTYGGSVIPVTNSASGSSSTTGTSTITASAGQLVILFIDASTNSIPTLTSPTNLPTLTSINTFSGAHNIGCFAAIATGAVSGAITWSTTSCNYNVVAVTGSLGTVSTAIPQSKSGTISGSVGASGSSTSPSLTSSIASTSIMISMFSFSKTGAGTVNFTAGTGMTTITKFGAPTGAIDFSEVSTAVGSPTTSCTVSWAGISQTESPICGIVIEVTASSSPGQTIQNAVGFSSYTGSLTASANFKGTPAIVPSPIGAAWQCLSATPANFQGSATMVVNSAYTISAWMCPQASSGEFSIGLHTNTSGVNPSCISFSPTIGGSAKPGGIYAIYSGGSAALVSPAYTYTVNTWYLVTGVFANTGSVKLYINGVLVTGTGSGSNPSNESLSFFGIGTDINTAPAQNCFVSDVRVYNVALTAQQVFQLYDPVTRYSLYETKSRKNYGSIITPTSNNSIILAMNF